MEESCTHRRRPSLISKDDIAVASWADTTNGVSATKVGLNAPIGAAPDDPRAVEVCDRDRRLAGTD
jgi:hypothetical protein